MTHGFNFSDTVKVVEGKLIGVVETKVKAASTVAAITGLALSLLGAYAFKTDVPAWAQALIDTAVTGGLTFVAGWLAKHTPRTIEVPTPAAPTDVPPAA